MALRQEKTMGFATLSPSYKLQVWLGPHRL